MQPDRERDLDRELRDLGPHVEYPPVPDLARSVRSRLETEAGGSESSTRSGPQLWWIAAAALALLIAVPAFSLAIQGMGGGALSVGGGAAGGGGDMAESGGQAAQGGGAVNESRTVPLLEEQEDGTPGGAESTQPPLAMESGASSSAGSGASAAACFSPEATLEARPSGGSPGDEFSIRGENFDADLRDCDDDPDRDVRVEFLQGGRTWELGSVEADKGLGIDARLEVPDSARPGRATVRATHGQGPLGTPYGRMSAEARFSVLE